MAELICPSCGQPGPEGQVMCPICVVPLTPAAATGADSGQAPPPGPPSSSSAPPSVPAPPSVSAPIADGKACDDPDCAHAGRVPRAGSTTCGRLPRVRFPWGTTPVAAGTPLLIGRAEEPLAGDLAEYGNVSRRHAVIRNDGGDLLITDLNSANGTFVNDEVIPPGREFRLHGRDTVRFGARLAAEIDLSETQ